MATAGVFVTTSSPPPRLTTSDAAQSLVSVDAAFRAVLVQVSDAAGGLVIPVGGAQDAAVGTEARVQLAALGSVEIDPEMCRRGPGAPWSFTVARSGATDAVFSLIGVLR